MGKGGCGKEAIRIILWGCWVTNMLITTVYYILSFATFDALYTSFRDLHIGISNHIWRAPLAAAVLGGLLVLLFNVLSCVILIRKSINKSGPGFGYGFIVAMCFTLAFFTLLCGLVMDGFKGVVANELEKQSGWTKYNTGAYLGTVGFAYLCFCMFLLFFFALVIFQGAVTENLGIGHQMQQVPYGRMADMPLSAQMGGMPGQVPMQMKMEGQRGQV